MQDSLFDLGAPSWDGAWVVRRISAETAQKWIGQYHYSGKRNPSSSDFGVFARDMIGTVSIGEAANAFGVVRKYELEPWRGNKEITRVAVHPDAPKNTATRCISMVCHMMSDEIDWLFSYADTGQNHHGGIYQGLNSVYVGVSAAGPGYMLDGKPCHPRTVVSMFGTQGVDAPAIAKLQGHELVKVEGMNTAKHLYILPIGPKRTQRAIRRHLRRWAKPYPKR